MTSNLLSQDSMKVPILTVSCFFMAHILLCQEALITDLKGCERIYWIKDDLVKQIKSEQDTFNYYHDEELIIYYNRNKTKELAPNTFYLINHGFNKLITLKVLLTMVEFSTGKKNKDTLINNPSEVMEIFHEDSLAKGAYTRFTFSITGLNRDKWKIISYLLEIKYYDKTIYRSFLKPIDIADFLPSKSL